MDEYSLGLALFDYIPVLLSALGLTLLAGLLGHPLPASRPVLVLAIALVIAGGISKASWKLLWVLSQTDIALLSHLLFILMAPGMILLAFHVYAASRAWNGREPSHPARNAAFVIIAIMGLAAALASSQQAGKAWFFTLLAAAALANISMGVLLIRLSWRWQERVAAAMFLFNLVIVLSLSGLSRISEGSALLQWLAECLNTLAHGSFAWAVWRLRRVIPSTPATA